MYLFVLSFCTLLLLSLQQDPGALFQRHHFELIDSKEDENVTIPCLLKDKDVSSFVLVRADGNPLPENLSFTSDSDTGIIIHKVQRNFKGEYRCSVIKNGRTVLSKEYQLEVQPVPKVPPEVSVTKHEEVLKAGERFHVVCIIKDVFSTVSGEWLSPNNITLPNENRSRFGDDHYEKEIRLVISSVTVSDSGMYICRADNVRGISQSAVYLKVVERGFINITSPENTIVYVNEGESQVLAVHLNAYPRPEECYWMYNDQILPNSSENCAESMQEDGSKITEYTSELNLVRLRGTEAGTYTFFASNSDTNFSVTYKVYVNTKPEILTSESLENDQIRCVATGFPAPQIIWYICAGAQNRCMDTPGTSQEERQVISRNVSTPVFGNIEVESTVALSKQDHKTTIECVAYNEAGQSYAVFRNNIEERTHALFTPLLIGFVAAAILLCIIVSVLSYMYQQKPKYQVQWKVIEEINGNNYVYIDPAQLPYDYRWEFPRDRLRFGKTLGSGAFGKVVEAAAYGLSKTNQVITVAVKMLKPSAHSTEKEALMSELKVLSYLGQHMNIVNLLGACTTGGPTLVITEYCCYGDLLNFLRRKRSSFICTKPGADCRNKAVYMNLASQKETTSNGSGEYMVMKPSPPGVSPLTSNKAKRRSQRHGSWNDDDIHTDLLDDDSIALSVEDLLSFSYQVAQGMNFLASRNCIHRDLAARNILLTHGHIAKICDFGLARDIKNDSNYVVKGNARLPVKWMAPESIFDCVYTFESDVWSYGILLWEIFSLGSSPYPGMPVDSKFYKMIKDGCRMCSPDFAPSGMYEIMKACWDSDPLARPSFRKIVEMVEQQLSESTKHTYINLANEFANREQTLTRRSERLDSVVSNTGSTQPILVHEDVFYEDEQSPRRHHV